MPKPPPRRADQRRAAIRPVAATANAFTVAFAEAVAAAGLTPVEIDDRIGRLMGARGVIVLHWPEEFFDAIGVYDRAKAWVRLGELAVARARGARLVWVVHDIVPPAAIVADRMLRRLLHRFLTLVDGCLALSRYAADTARALYPELANKVWGIIRHPLYAAPLPPRTAAIAPDRPIRLCWFGRIMPYRQPLELIAAAAPLAGLVTLSMHGAAVDPAFGARVAAAAAEQPHVSLTAQRHAEAALAAAVDAADAIMLPYARITHSGAAIYALGRGKPVVSVQEGALPELRDEVGGDWLRLLPGPIDAAGLRDALAWVRAPRTAAPRLEGYAWADQQPALDAFFAAVAAR